MTLNQSECPFTAGDIFVYRPTNKGRGSIIMTDLSALKPGETYTVARVEQNVYLVVKGFENATPGGLYWTEFSAK